MTRGLPAKALFYAVIVSILVALVCAAILLGSYHQHQLLGRYRLQERLLDNCHSGMALLLSSTSSEVPQLVLDLYGEHQDSVSLEVRPWGLLDLAQVESWSGQGQYRAYCSKACLLGALVPSDYALKLAESTHGLHLYGDTRLVGNAYLPDEGIERGYANLGIGGSYTGDQLIEGTWNLAKPLDKTKLEARFDYLNDLKVLPLNGSLAQDSLVQPFHLPTLVIGEEAMSTAGLVMKGNIVVVASDYIEIAANSRLEDVLLLAPRVVIRSGFQGAIQVFAWDSLLVEPNVVLEFPSALSLLPQVPEAAFSPKLTLAEEVELWGTILVPTFRYHKYPPLVHVQAGTFITGQVWVNGRFQHRGTVHGTVVCDEFWLETPASVYKNYLLDAVINRPALPDAYLTPSVLGKEGEKRVLKYL